jgi:hypothetical protein
MLEKSGQLTLPAPSLVSCPILLYPATEMIGKRYSDAQIAPWHRDNGLQAPPLPGTHIPGD